MSAPQPIQKSHRGRLHRRLHVKPGQTILLARIAADKRRAQARGDASAVRQDTYAINARHWRH